MFLRLLFGILFFFLFISCDFFSSERISDKTVSLTADTFIDYSSVDVYPIFKECEKLEGEDSLEQCFGNEIIKKLENLILIKNIPSPIPVNDTVFVDLLIDTDNKIKTARIRSSQEIKDKIPNLDSILIEGIKNLPLLASPALKRGIPVVSQFKLPVVIREKQ